MHPVGVLSKVLNKSLCLCVCGHELVGVCVCVYIEAILTENSYSNT